MPRFDRDRSQSDPGEDERVVPLSDLVNDPADLDGRKRAARSDHRSVSAFVRLMILSKLHELGYLDEDFGIKDPDIEETVPDGLPAVKAS